MNQVLIGDCRELLKDVPDKSVHCCVTSPPYFGLRDYGVEGQIGLEQTPEDYVNELVTVFREVRRVLRDDGTLWLNLGDSYWGGKGKSSQAWSTYHQDRSTLEKTQHQICGKGETRPTDGKHAVIKPKDLIGIPWRVALALQADGWYLRSDIIWSKNNPMPESVTDRPTKAHEYIFLLSKFPKYYFDNDAIKEPISESSIKAHMGKKITSASGAYSSKSGRNGDSGLKNGDGRDFSGRNKRSVWTINSKPYKGAHFATFPPALIEPCIKAGTSEKGVCSECGSQYKRVMEKTGQFQRRWSTNNAEDSPYNKQDSFQNVYSTVDWHPSCTCNAPSIPATVLDPFGGSGTVGEVCNKLGRNSILIELNPEYKPLIDARCSLIDVNQVVV
jgi:DNA modification methylase